MTNMRSEKASTYIKYLILDIFASVFYAISINVFTVHADFAPGGVSGLSVIMNYLLNIPVGIASLLINIPVIVFTFKRLGIGFFIRSVKTMIISAAITDLTASIMPQFMGNRILSAFLAGLFMGIAVGIIFSQDSSFGGSDFITMAVKKAKPDLSIGVIAWVVNASVIVLAAFIFHQMFAVFLGMVHIVVDCVVLDLVMKAIDKYRQKTSLKQKEKAED